VTSTAATLLGECSQRNSYSCHIIGLYLYSSGVGRQPISVLNRLGLSISWSTLAGGGGKCLGYTGKNDDMVRQGTETEDNEKTTKSHTHHLRTLECLSSSMCRLTQQVAAVRPLLLMYDNVNMLWKVAEQIIGRTGGWSNENGECCGC
jgi:hypothetical protein